jgi:hypothetical protein
MSSFGRSLWFGYVLFLGLLVFVLAKPADTHGQFRGNALPPPLILPGNNLGLGVVGFGGFGGFPAFENLLSGRLVLPHSAGKIRSRTFGTANASQNHQMVCPPEERGTS